MSSGRDNSMNFERAILLSDKSASIKSSLIDLETRFGLFSPIDFIVPASAH
jgi:hypothetical protein